MTKIKFGPSGIDGVKQAQLVLEKYSKQGIKAAEIPFTYGIWMKNQEAIIIGKIAKKLDIRLSIHAPYWINLNSEDKTKIKQSIERILRCCEIGHHLSSEEKTRIIFHPGFYGKNKEQAFNIIKEGILELIQEIKTNNWNVELCPETMGKINVFGSLEEISELVEQTKCGFCIDFAHVLARYGDYNFDLVKKLFPQKQWQCHFSGIEYGDKGEKKHKTTSKEDWKELLTNIPNDKEIIIINESPSPVEDSLKGLEVLKSI